MRKFYYKEKKMEIKQKHGKHALRKAVTAAVLAGTAFSSLGGFAGAVTTVKADGIVNGRSERPKLTETKDYDKIISVFASFKSGQAKVADLRRVLKEADLDTLHILLSGLDPADLYYEGGANILYSLANTLNTFQNDRSEDEDFYHRNGINLITLLIQEITDRIIQNEQRGKEIDEKNIALESLKESEETLRKEKDKVEGLFSEVNAKVKLQEEELSKKEADLTESKEELMEILEDLDKAKDSIEEKEAKVKDLSEKLDTSRKEHEELAKEFAESQKGYEKELADKHNALGEAEKQNQDLTNENKELKENLGTAEEITNGLQKKVMDAEKAMKELEAELKSEKEALEAEKAKLAESEKENSKLTEERDAAKKEAEKVPELEEQVEKLVEEITAAKKEAEELQAKAEGLEKDFEAVKAEKEALEAEIAKLKEDHQKEVDALNALLADKEKMLKNLQDQLDKAKEEAMKNEQMSQEEKAKLQAELDKAKQELAEKIKDMPNKVAPQAEGKANAGQAAPNQNNQAQANQTKNGNNLPSTGDKPVNPLLVASGLSLMIGAGAFVYAGKRKKG